MFNIPKIQVEQTDSYNNATEISWTSKGNDQNGPITEPEPNVCWGVLFKAVEMDVPLYQINSILGCRPRVYFYIVSELNDKVLDVKGNDEDPGAEIIMWRKKDDPADNQLWYSGRDGLLRSKLNGFVIDSTGKSSLTD